MKRNLSFVQEIQDSYSAWTGLTIMICDRTGALQTDISWESRQSEEQFAKYVTQDSLRTFLEEFHTIPQAMLLDTKFGVQIILSPILIKNRQTDYFIISGVIVKRDSDEVIADYLQDEGMLAYIQMAESLSDSEIQKKIEKITNMAVRISSYFAMVDETKIVKGFSSLLSDRLKQLTNGTLTYQSILEMGTFFEEVDFMGVALPVKKHRYAVESMIGNDADRFVGYEFDIGEGIMGYTIATQRPKFYEDITNDVRRSLFLNEDMNVVGLFCFPLMDKSEIIGLLFGGSSERKIRRTPHLYDSLSTCATVLNNHLLSGKVQTVNRDLQIETEMLSDILAAYPTARSLKKTLYLIIDIGMNTMNFEFLSIVYMNHAKNDRLEIMSKGLSEDEVQDYCNQLAEQLIQTETLESSDIVLTTTPWGAPVAEIPIIVSGNTYGTLSVGLKTDRDIERFSNVLSGLATAVGIAIFFIKEEKIKYNKEMTIDWIQVVLQNFKPDKYKLAQKIIDSASLFLRERGIKDFSLIETVALLAACNRDVLNAVVEDKDLIQLINDYFNVLENNSGGDRQLEVVAIMWTYYANEEAIDSIFELELIHDELKSEFVSFLKREETGQKTIQLQNIKQPKSQQDELGLTKREEEVLKEMMKGFGNKEIGANLFISEHTVKNHITSILSKLGVADRSQAIAKVYQMGNRDELY